jgi:hypothetical protein
VKLNGEHFSLIFPKEQANRLRAIAEAGEVSVQDLLTAMVEPMLESDDDSLVWKPVAINNSSYEYLLYMYGESTDDLLDEILDSGILREKGSGSPGAERSAPGST